MPCQRTFVKTDLWYKLNTSFCAEALTSNPHKILVHTYIIHGHNLLALKIKVCSVFVDNITTEFTVVFTVWLTNKNFYQMCQDIFKSNHIENPSILMIILPTWNVKSNPGRAGHALSVFLHWKSSLLKLFSKLLHLVTSILGGVYC